MHDAGRAERAAAAVSVYTARDRKHKRSHEVPEEFAEQERPERR